MKNKGLVITLIVLLSVVAISLTACLVIFLTGGFKRFGFILFSDVSNELVLEEEYEDHFKLIEVEADASEVEIYESENDKVKVIIYGDEKNIDVTSKGGRLVIHSKMNCHFFCFGKKRSKIEIYLPKDYQEKIKVDNDYGNIEIADFKNATIDVEANCGDIKVGAGNEVKLENDFGDIELGFANKAEIKQNAGNVKVGEIGDIKAQNDFGNIEIEKVTNSLDLKDNCGNVEIDEVILMKDSSIKNDLGDIKIGFTNKIYIDAETDLGKVKINENTKNSDVTLTLKNNCGDIIVDN